MVFSGNGSDWRSTSESPMSLIPETSVKYDESNVLGRSISIVRWQLYSDQAVAAETELELDLLTDP